MISIIVPVYNVESYIRQCIDSILAQGFCDWELILVDDGSTDKSGEICDEYINYDKRISVYHNENSGVSFSRNFGIHKANGEWITFIDADDFIGKGFLKGLVEPILQGHQLDFVHGGCTNYEGGHITSINQEYDYFISNDKGRLFTSFRGLVVSKLFKASILKEKGVLFDEEMKIAEDMAFTLDYLLIVENYAFVPEMSYYYRRDNYHSATHHIYQSSFLQASHESASTSFESTAHPGCLSFLLILNHIQ